MIQNFESYQDVPTLQVTTYQTPKTDAQGNAVKDAKGNPVMVDNKADKQTIAMGPVASQEAIKMLGTNGGGFFNANSAHPYENPTPFSNFVQMIAMLVIPAALCAGVRPDGRRPAAGLRRARRDDDRVSPSRAGVRSASEQSRQSAVRVAACRPERRPRCSRAATRKARKRASASRSRASSRSRPPRLRAARSTTRTTRSRRWAASFRCC